MISTINERKPVFSDNEKYVGSYEKDVDEFYQIENVFGKPSTSIFSKSIPLIFIFVAICLLGSMYIKYPDIIEAPVLLTFENPPVKIYPQVNGYIHKLIVEDKNPVKKGDLLAILEADIKWDKVNLLESIIDSFKFNVLVAKYNLPEISGIGGFSKEYNYLRKNVNKYQKYLENDFKSLKVAHLANEINITRKLNISNVRKKELFYEELSISKANYFRNVKLNNQGVVSDVTLEQVKTDYLKNKRFSQDITTNILQNEIRLEQLKSQISDLVESDDKEKTELISEIKNSIANLKEALNSWKNKYCIYATTAGLVSYGEKIWTENQYASKETSLLSIVPPKGTEKMRGRAILKTDNAGKVKEGDKGLIHFESYPSKEYGVLECKIHSKALVPNDEGYVISLELLNQELVTSYNLTIPSEQNLKGIVHINTRDKTIFSRIFNQVFSVIRNK